jgi:ABC-2 type transport system ATP-binding protein
VLLSSHIIADLEQSCDYLIILSDSRVQLAGDMRAIQRSHVVLEGPSAESEMVIRANSFLAHHIQGEQSSLLIRTNGNDPIAGPNWRQHDATTEDIVLAYLEQAATTRPIIYPESSTLVQQDMEVAQ